MYLDDQKKVTITKTQSMLNKDYPFQGPYVTKGKVKYQNVYKLNTLNYVNMYPINNGLTSI